ncbi:hypothetical protein VCV18_012577 [Metarhizium anisopliae]
MPLVVVATAVAATRPSSQVPNATYQPQPQYRQLQGFPPAQQYYAHPPYLNLAFNRLHSMDQGFIESDTRSLTDARSTPDTDRSQGNV